MSPYLQCMKRQVPLIHSRLLPYLYKNHFTTYLLKRETNDDDDSPTSLNEIKNNKITSKNYNKVSNSTSSSILPYSIEEALQKLRSIEDLNYAIQFSFNLLIAHQKQNYFWWKAVANYFVSISLNETSALLLFIGITRLKLRHQQLLQQISVVLENAYLTSHVLSTELSNVHPLLQAGTSFQKIIQNLPIEYKIKLIIGDQRSRDDGLQRQLNEDIVDTPLPNWHTMQPVDMQQWEAAHPHITNSRSLKASVYLPPPAKKLKSILGMQLYAALHSASIKDISLISTIYIYTDALCKGSLDTVVHSVLFSRILKTDEIDVSPHLLMLTSSLNEIWDVKVAKYLLKIFLKFWFDNELRSTKGIHLLKKNNDDSTDESKLNQIKKFKCFIKITSNFMKCNNFKLRIWEFNKLMKRLIEDINTLEEVHSERCVLSINEISDVFNGFVESGLFHLEAASILLKLLQRNFSSHRKSNELLDRVEIQRCLYNAGGSVGDLVLMLHSCAVHELFDEEAMLQLLQMIQPFTLQLTPLYKVVLLESMDMLELMLTEEHQKMRKLISNIKLIQQNN